MAKTCEVEEQCPEFDADNFSVDMIPECSWAITHVSEHYITPRSWALLKAEGRAALCDGWDLTDSDLQHLVTVADNVSIVYFAEQLEDHGPAPEAVKPTLQKLRDALIDLNNLDNKLLSGLLWRIPSLFPNDLDQARQRINAGIVVTSTLTHPRAAGRPKDSKPRALACAIGLIESWRRKTGRAPTPGKKRPSIRSFYAKLLPLLQVPSGVRVYGRDEPPFDTFQNDNSFVDEVLKAMERELKGKKKRPKPG